MSRIRVNPNRMELMRMRRSHAVATRGHKLLKDKLDELMKEFLGRIEETRRLRLVVEDRLAHGYGLFAIARGEAGPQVFLAALMAHETPATVSVRERSVMSVRIPDFGAVAIPDPEPYSFASTPTILDEATEAFTDLAPSLVELAQREKAVELLAAEIEVVRRRVNALEHVLIPQQVEAIREIQMKLDEAERANITRLMKVKEIIERERGGGQ